MKNVLACLCKSTITRTLKFKHKLIPVPYFSLSLRGTWLYSVHSSCELDTLGTVCFLFIGEVCPPCLGSSIKFVG